MVSAQTPVPKVAPRLLSPAEVRVSLHKLLGSVIGETDGKLAVLAIALDANNGSRGVGCVAHALADERIRGASRAPQAGLRCCTGSGWRGAGRAGRRWRAPHPADEFCLCVGVCRIGFVAPRFAGGGKGTLRR